MFSSSASCRRPLSPRLFAVLSQSPPRLRAIAELIAERDDLRSVRLFRDVQVSELMQDAGDVDINDARRLLEAVEGHARADREHRIAEYNRQAKTGEEVRLLPGLTQNGVACSAGKVPVRKPFFLPRRMRPQPPAAVRLPAAVITAQMRDCSNREKAAKQCWRIVKGLGPLSRLVHSRGAGVSEDIFRASVVSRISSFAAHGVMQRLATYKKLRKWCKRQGHMEFLVVAPCQAEAFLKECLARGRSVPAASLAHLHWLKKELGAPFHLEDVFAPSQSCQPSLALAPHGNTCGTPPASIKLALHFSVLSRSHPCKLKRYYASVACCCLAASLRIVDAQRSSPPIVNGGLVQGCSFRGKDPRRRAAAPPMPWHGPRLDLLPGEPCWPVAVCRKPSEVPDRDYLFPDIEVDKDSWVSALPHEASHGKVVSLLRMLAMEPPLSLSVEEAASFAGHSFRGSLDTAADAMGIPEDERRCLGRWRAKTSETSMPNRYSGSRVLALHRLQSRIILSMRRAANDAAGENSEVSWSRCGFVPPLDDEIPVGPAPQQVETMGNSLTCVHSAVAIKQAPQRPRKQRG